MPLITKSDGIRTALVRPASRQRRSQLQLRRGVLITLLVVAWMATPAEAQWVATLLLGFNLSGDVEHGKGGIGGSIGYFGARLGFEFDLQRHWHFFKDRDIDFVPNCGVAPANVPCADVDTRAWTVMGNVIMPIRQGSAANWRPYGAAGLGLVTAWFGDGNQVDVRQNNFAFNVGGGVMYSLNSRVGLRGDVRYFRALVDERKRDAGFFEDYGFWRATFGVTFRFPRKFN